jgi:hypothetical protein
MESTLGQTNWIYFMCIELCYLSGLLPWFNGTKFTFLTLWTQVRCSSKTDIRLKSKGFWRWCIIICKRGFLDFVHRLHFSNITFRKLDLLPSSGKKEGQKPQLLGPLVELASDLDCFNKSKSLCDWRLVSHSVLASSPFWDSSPDVTPQSDRYCVSRHVASSLTRGRVCHLLLLLQHRWAVSNKRRPTTIVCGR